MSEFEPKIMAFLCNWCSYAGADLAGVSRLQYPPTVRIIRTMCSGRIDPIIVLEMLARGADGVLVLGCHPGDCHYIEGNYQAERRINAIKKLMSQTSINPDRLRLEWVSASEGERFAEIVKEFTNQVKAIGRSPLAEEKPDTSALQEILAAKAAMADFRLRALVNKERKLIEEGNIYGEKVSQEEFDNLVDSAISAEYVRSRILLLTKEESLSIKEIANRIGVPVEQVVKHIATMRGRGWIALDRIDGTSPLYTALEVGE